MDIIELNEAILSKVYVYSRDGVTARLHCYQEIYNFFHRNLFILNPREVSFLDCLWPPFPIHTHKHAHTHFHNDLPHPTVLVFLSGNMTHMKMSNENDYLHDWNFSLNTVPQTDWKVPLDMFCKLFSTSCVTLRRTFVTSIYKFIALAIYWVDTIIINTSMLTIVE